MFHAKIANELDSRNDIEKAAKLFSNLNIAAEGIKVVTKMEWNGKYDPNANTESQSVLDSDDDEETDPLKILAQSRDIRKIVKTIRTDVKLITDADLAEISEANRSDGAEDGTATVDAESNAVGGTPTSIELEPHAIYLCEMETHHGNKTQYFPYKTTTSNVHSMEAEKARKMGKHWEITAATPPPIRNSSAKVLSLQESIDIQKKQYDMLKVSVCVCVMCMCAENSLIPKFAFVFRKRKSDTPKIVWKHAKNWQPKWHEFVCQTMVVI